MISQQRNAVARDSLGAVARRFVLAVGAVLLSSGLFAAETLPEGYTALEWIQSTGTQYLKTGYIHKSNTKVECELMAYRDGGPWATVFGSCNDNLKRNAYIFYVRNFNESAVLGKPCYNRTGAQAMGAKVFPFEQRVKLTCDGLVASWQGLDDTTIADSIPASGGMADAGTNGMYIFDLNKYNGSGGDAPDGSKAVMRLYSFRISEGATVVHDYVPCRNAAGAAGLYDLKDGEFLANAGSGAFIGSDEPLRPFLKIKRVIAPAGSYVNTEFNPNQNTRTVLNVVVGNPREYWFGAWNLAYNGDAYALGNDDKEVYSGYDGQGGGVFSPQVGNGPHKIELDKNLVKIDDTTKKTFNAATFQVECPLTLFVQNRKNEASLVAGLNARQIICSSAQVYDNGKLIRDYTPVLSPWGKVGFADAAHGNAFYGSGCLTLFSYDGIGYLENGTTLVAYVGTLAGDVLAGYTALEKDGLNDTLNAAAVTDFAIPVTVKAGTYSLADQTAKRYAFPSLTLKGGAKLAFDLMPDGCDTLAATTLQVSDATAENPVSIVVTPYNTLGVGATPRTLIESGVAAADLAKFRLEPGVPAKLEVRGGALVLVADEQERTLPAGYAALDFVRSTGLQVVKTGISATSDTITEMSFGRIRYAHGTVFFGQGTWASNNYLFNMQSDKIMFHSSGATAWTGVPESTDFRVWVGAGKLILSAVGGAATTNAASNAVNTGSPELAIFALNTGSSGGAFDFYAMKIADKTGRLLRDYVPCRNSDGEPGLWDFVSQSFFYNTGAERLFTADDVDVRLTRLQAKGGCYIDTGFVPNQNSRVVMDVFPNGLRETWFGAWKVDWQNGAFSLSNDGDYMYAGFGGGYNAASNPRTPASVVDGVRHLVELDKREIRVDGVTRYTCAETTFSSDVSLFLFGVNKNGAFIVNSFDQRVSCYGAKVYDNGTLVRDYVPTRQADGTMGMTDVQNGGQFRPNANFRTECAYRMTWDGLAYTLDGAALEAREGTLSTNEVATFAEVRKVGWYAVNASAVTNYPGALSLVKGVFSLKDNVPRRHAVAGALTLGAGAKLAIDVTPDGCDALEAQSVTLAATAENPVEVAVNAAGLAELAADAKLAIFPGAAFDAADASKFKVVGFPAQFAVEDGALWLVPKETGVATWTGAAGDGKWSTALNWRGNEVPEAGVTVKFDLPAGGETTFDIAGGRSFKAILFDVGAGAFTVVGQEALGVMTAITNLSASAQTFAGPVNLGVVGQSVGLVTTGDLGFTGGISVIADEVVKDGAGLLTMDDTDLWNMTGITVRNGLLRTRYTGRVNAATPQDGFIRIEDGGMLDVYRDLGNETSLARVEAFHGKTVYVAGDGDGRGAIYNSYPSSNWGTTFGKVVLTDDASIGGTILAVRPLPGSRIPGATIEGGHTLTVKTILHDPTLPSRALDLMGTRLALDRVNVTGNLTIDEPQSGAITNGVHLYDGSGLHFFNATVPANCAAVVVEEGTAKLSSISTSTTASDLSVREGTRLVVDISVNVTFNGAVTVEGVVGQMSGSGVMNLGGTLSGGGRIEGGNIRFSGANSRWQMTADDTGFTSKVDVSGVTDAAFLNGLKAIDVVYTGTASQTLEIASAGTLTTALLEQIALTVTNGADEPVPNCWLWIEGGKLTLHLIDGDYVRAATWLGGADDDIANPEKWLCSNTVGQVSGKVPMRSTVVTLPDGCAFTCTNGAPFACQRLNLPATLGGDSDFRGVTAPLNGTMDLKGHKVYFSRADGSVTITDGEYQPIEWLRAPKGAYIDTGFVPSSESRVKMDLAVGGTLENWFGSAGDGANWWKDCAFALANDGGGIYVGHGEQSGTTGEALNAGWRGTVELNQNVFTATPLGETNPAQTIPKTKQSFKSKYNLFLFAVNTAENPSGNRFKNGNNVTCYGCQIYDKASDEQPVRDLVPVICVTNNAVGMIDRANGNKWYGNVGSPAFEAGPAKAMSDVGEVHFDIPEGETVTNTGILMKGTLKMVKDGKGTLLGSKTGQAYYGGTEIADGLFKAWTTQYPVNCGIVVDEGATYDVDGYNVAERTGYISGGLVLNGGTVVNRTSDVSWAALPKIKLTAGSTLQSACSWNITANQFAEASLDLGGNTFTIDVAAGKVFYVNNCTITPGTLKSTGSGRLEFTDKASRFDDVSLDLGTALGLRSDVTVRDLAVNYAGTAKEGDRHVYVEGTYAPNSDYTHNFVLKDGSTVDLRGRRTSFDISAKTVTFADGATVTVDVRGRYNLGRGAVIKWDPSNPPAASVTFKPPQNAGYLVTRKADGVYVSKGMLITVR